jgi:uncharacterized protein YbaP (TraB family)
MNKVIAVLMTLCFLPFIYGQNIPKTILWKVMKPGSKYESFLFGTFHEVSPSFFDSLTEAVTKLQQSDILFVEQSITSSNEQLLTSQPLWSLKKWNSILTSEQAQTFTEFAKRAEDTSYYSLNPLLLTLTTSRLYLTNFCDSAASFPDLMDHHIERLAIKDKKQIRSLDINHGVLLKKEALGFSPLQDSLYASYSIHFMKSMLNNDLSSCQLVSAYKKFDINYEFDKDLFGDAASSILLIKRNKQWVRLLHKSFSSKNCFVAVGVRHLFYKQGLIQLLRNLGYRVTPLQIAQ